MTEYRFTRRFDSPAYWCLYAVTAMVACGFLAASSGRPVALIFALLFGIVTGFGVYTLFRRSNAGVVVSESTLTYWATGLTSENRTISLGEVAGLRYKRHDHEVIYLDLFNGQTIAIDERYFCDICELVAAICASRTDITPVCLSGPRCR